jgi:hypothetical protein
MRFPRPTYANVTATLALCVALGGTSYAALKLPANSVGSAQIRDGAITAPKIKVGSLTAKLFARNQIPRGPRGAQGPVGAAGPAGATGPQGTTGAAGPTEGDNISGPWPLPATLVDQFDESLTGDYATFTTARAGRLALTVVQSAALACQSSDYIWWWIVLDGSPVRGSLLMAQPSPDGLASTPLTVTGVTDAVMPAGQYNVALGAMCGSGLAGAGFHHRSLSGQVIVLG